ncbi:MAG: 5-bromo-4-chloroindolyl phosphate hydrolysis family protein [Alphaproteobacteria bacterium]|nr:5-bromo-4-chloroindolyl phosphate hydrolysis family protein [Alphaproteobacteria bacterium SS10]
MVAPHKANVMEALGISEIADRQALTTAIKAVDDHMKQLTPVPWREWGRQLFAGAAAAALVVLADLYAGMGWMEAGLCGVIAWIGLSVMVEPDAPSLRDQNTWLSVADLYDGLTRLAKSIDALRNLKMVSVPTARHPVDQMCDILLSIAEDYRVDPGDVVRSRTFLHHHVPMAVEVAQTVDRLSARGGLSEEQDIALQDAIQQLHTIRDAFERQLQALARNDTDDLKITGDVLDSLLIKTSEAGATAR